MPYQALLDDLVRSVRGAQAALLLDALGEVVIEAGAREHRHRLIGAYQGIALTRIRRLSGRHELGPVQDVVWRYATGSVILQPLKDGYYLVLSLGEDASLAAGLHRTRVAARRVDVAL